MNKRQFLVGVASVILAVSGCSTGASQTSAPPVATGGPSNTANTIAPSTIAPSTIAPSDVLFLNVVKIAGIGWFDTMQKGMESVAASTGMKVEQTGPTQATAEAQVSIIQGLIPRKPSVIGIVPNNQQALEGVLKNAHDAGIKIIASEGPDMANVDLDIEAMDNASYGATMMDSLAQCMGGQGTYVAFVGHLTAATHMAWVEAAWKHAQEKYTGIKRVEIVETLEDGNVAYQKTKEVLQKYPDLKGIEGSGGTDPQGAGRAITEMGLKGKVCVVGTSLPSLSGQYVKDGTVYRIFGWSPLASGQALAQGAFFLGQGGVPKAGLDLHVEGYHNMQPCGGTTKPSCFVGDAGLSIGKENIDQYDF